MKGIDILKQIVADSRARQPALGAEVRAMGRELVKDVRATLHEALFGQPEHASEPGTPLSLTPREVYEQKHEQGQPEMDM